MSEHGDLGQAEPAASTAGSLLREAREAAGLHIAALAVSLKVPVRKLELLEADRWDALPDPVFVRALASSACRALKVDPAPVLALLPRAAPTTLKDDRSLGGASMPGSEPMVWTAGYRLLLRPPGVWILLLLLGSLILALWPASAPDQTLIREASSVVVPALSASAGVAAVSADAPTSAALKGLPASPVQTLTASTPSTVAAAAPVSVASGPALIEFRARSTAWVEVVDARQVVVLRRTLAPGETAAAAGAMPLAVVVGRVDATDVTVRGQSFDLQTVARDNVARFEVK